MEWCELTFKFLERSRDTSAMLNVFMERLYPNSWSGSLADTLTNRAELLEALPVKEDYRSQLSEKIKELRKLAEKKCVSEAKRSRHESNHLSKCNDCFYG